MVSSGRKLALLLGAVSDALAGVVSAPAGNYSTWRAGSTPAATAIAGTAART